VVRAKPRVRRAKVGIKSFNKSGINLPQARLSHGDQLLGALKAAMGDPSGNADHVVILVLLDHLNNV